MNTRFSCWRYVQQPLGIYEPEGKRLLEDHLANKMNYEEFSKKTVSLWKGLNIADFERIISKIPLRKGTIEILNYFKNAGYKVACISSGFDLWKTVFETEYSFNFDDYLANHIIVDKNGILTGEIEMKVTDDTPAKNKGEHLKMICNKYNFDQEEAIMVGDGLGDIKAFKPAGLSIAVNPTHREVSDAADYVISGDSLLELIEIFEMIQNKSESKAGKEKRF